MRTRTFVVLMLIWCGWGAVHISADDSRLPQSYRHVDLLKPCQRTYGGYWWTAESGDICEEGITVQGSPLVCSNNTMLVLNAATAEAGDLHFVDGDIRRTWVNGSRSTSLHVFTRLCSDPLVGSWGTYEPVFFRFKPGVMVEDVRRPEHATAGAATFRYDATLTRVVDPISEQQIDQGWIPQGRDVPLEQRILGHLLARSAQAGPAMFPPVVRGNDR